MAAPICRCGAVRGALGPKEAAEWLGIGQTALYELLGRGEIQRVKVRAATLIPVASLQAYLERQP